MTVNGRKLGTFVEEFIYLSDFLAESGSLLSFLRKLKFVRWKSSRVYKEASWSVFS